MGPAFIAGASPAKTDADQLSRKADPRHPAGVGLFVWLNNDIHLSGPRSSIPAAEGHGQSFQRHPVDVLGVGLDHSVGPDQRPLGPA
jgi:hypothetical protein